MNHELNKLIERFEVEIWLYLDGSLNETEKRFWDDQLVKHPQLQNIFDQTNKVLDTYSEYAANNLHDSEFQQMITRATESKATTNTLSKYVSNFFEALFSNNLSAAKAAFAAVLTVAALVLLLTTEKPNAVKKISSELLSWKGESINEQINDVDESIQTLSMDEWEKYKMIQANYDKWEQSYYLLNQEIEQMQKDLGDTTL